MTYSLLIKATAVSEAHAADAHGDDVAAFAFPQGATGQVTPCGRPIASPSTFRRSSGTPTLSPQ